ncbi:hypothetical protein [Streptomyces sp. 604F]|uniref:hypothetical protein n=1 Tax=Streptomyces sp. 604F TaxID=1476754 RepID=UPI001EF25DC8|nr:hypothetical protein [Streptomyces sp. 604F]
MNHSRSNAGAPREPDLPPYQVVLSATDWGSLETPFGNGEDLPEVLSRLLTPDPRVQVNALSELGEMVGHQNTIYEATAPAAMYVAGILTHPAATTPRPYRNVPIRAALLNWLASTAYDASDEIVGRTEQHFPDLLAPGTIVASFRDLRPMLYRAVSPFLRDSHEGVREAAVIAALTSPSTPRSPNTAITSPRTRAPSWTPAATATTSVLPGRHSKRRATTPRLRAFPGGVLGLGATQ